MAQETLTHVGIASADAQATIAFFTKYFGAEETMTKAFPTQISHMLHFAAGGLEIMEATDPEGTVGKYLQKRGPGLHHISFDVKDITALIGQLESDGIRVIAKRLDDPAQRKVAFVDPRCTGGILIELVE